MNYRIFYDVDYVVLGCLTETDERTLSDQYITLNEGDWMKLTEKQGVIKLNPVDPKDLSKITLLPYPKDDSESWLFAELDKGKVRQAQTYMLNKLAEEQAVLKFKTMLPAEMEKVKYIFPIWKAGEQHSKTLTPFLWFPDFNGKLYETITTAVITSQESWAPDKAVSLYLPAKSNPADPIPQAWVQPIAPQVYNLADKVSHAGDIWESSIANNVWEPGIYGWVKK